jgi:hypothetical protein
MEDLICNILLTAWLWKKLVELVLQLGIKYNFN